MSHNLRPSCYYSPDLYADGHSTPEIHSNPQSSTTMLSSGWHALQCMQSSQETEIGLDRNLLPLKDLSKHTGSYTLDVQECLENHAWTVYKLLGEES
ncbi:hypothetical protein Q7C36_002887 [Tachysurus vachellii]|uniref:Uncharacterized protein n=1 Tax=Tachysurus vachellii TaxID=175792 RepID=A0AA88NP05_TACVA|nr:hypothetical protein Q7C36_002887 [Tachysurus vachellii]